MPLIDYLTRKPILGFTTSLLSITLTHLQILQAIGAVLGIVIAVVTAILKVLELKDRIYNKGHVSEDKDHKHQEIDSDMF